MYRSLSFSFPATPTAGTRLRGIAAIAQHEGYSGWVRLRGDRVEGKLVCFSVHNHTAVQHLTRTLDAEGDIYQESRDTDPFRFAEPRFRVLDPILDEAADDAAGIWLTVEQIDRRGVLFGWAHEAGADHKRLDLLISVDGAPVGRVKADQLRLDLLRAGVGDGEYGFAFEMPPMVLDGGGHTVSVAPTGTRPEAVRGADEKRLTFPALFTASGPWRSAEPGGAYKAFFALKSLVINGDAAAAAPALKEEITRHPELIFFDVGFDEACLRAGNLFPSFRERLVRRMGRWGPTAICDLGTACCKNHEAVDDEFVFQNCPQLLRHFSSKRFTKTYCERFRIRTSRTFLVSDNIAQVCDVAGSLSRFVLKPTDDSGQCTFIMSGGRNLLDRTPVALSEIRQALQDYQSRRPDASFLVEEFLTQNSATPGDVIPLDYKLHMFDAHLRLIQVDDRNVFYSRDPLNRQQGWFAGNWTPAPHRIRVRQEEAIDFRRPDRLEEMTEIACRIAAACGDYVRVDFFDTLEGVTLGEVTPFSHSGRGFTKFGDLTLSQAWELFSPPII
jgi:hypothetical protein